MQTNTQVVRRNGFTKTELLLVLGICLVLGGLLASAVGKVRETAARVSCAYKLKQLGAGMQHYHAAHNSLPPALRRSGPGTRCYRPSCNLNIPNSLPSEPGLKWWTELLEPYVENRNVFHCPRGTTSGYAMNGVDGGPAGMNLGSIWNGTSQVVLTFEHEGRWPICAYRLPPTGALVPWPFSAHDANRHYADRHGQEFLALFCDGHVSALTTRDLKAAHFYAH